MPDKAKICHISQMRPGLLSDIRAKIGVWCHMARQYPSGEIVDQCTRVPEWECTHPNGKLHSLYCTEHAKRFCAKNDLRMPDAPASNN